MSTDEGRIGMSGGSKVPGAGGDGKLELPKGS